MIMISIPLQTGDLVLIAFLIAVLLIATWFLAWFAGAYAVRKAIRRPHLTRSPHNPIVAPIAGYPWQSEAVFNPAAVLGEDGRVHLFYRAVGGDGVSRIGHASSADGQHFDERSPYPVFMLQEGYEEQGMRTGRPAYYKERYPVVSASGGGWGGSEDPRAVSLEGKIVLTFSAFQGWDSLRMMMTSLRGGDLARRAWRWETPAFLSPQGQVHKNWVLFPEKIAGKYAVIHSITPRIQICYVDALDASHEGLGIESVHQQSSGADHPWAERIRGAGAPPLKTPYGWLLFYHALQRGEPDRYKLGVMLLDLDHPERVLYRSSYPVLEPETFYENDGKPGVVYVCGTVVKDGTLYVYYGGGDKTVNLATAPLATFLRELIRPDHAVL